MKKEMLINVLQPEECRIAILEDGVLEELYVERTSHESYVGNIYKGRIVNIEPSIQAAFVDFGVGRNGFLHVSDVEPAYYRHLEQRRNEGPGRRGRDRFRGEEDDRGRRRRPERPPDRPPERPPERRPEFEPEEEPIAASEFLSVSEQIEVSRPPDMPLPEGDTNAELRSPDEGSPNPRRESREPKGDKPARGRRRSRGGARRRRKEPGQEENATPPAEMGEGPDSPPQDDREPPQFMESAERRTEEGEAESDSSHESGTSGHAPSSFRDEDLFFPRSEPDAQPRAAVPTEPTNYRDEEPSFEQERDTWTEPAGRGERLLDEEPLEEAESPPLDLESDDESDSASDAEAEHEERFAEFDEPFSEFEEEDQGFQRRPQPEGGRRDRGRRPGGPRRGGRPGMGRPKPLIQDIFRRGQEVLVQVIKEGIGTKGPTLSTYISIAGRYLVLMPGLSRVGVSRKIADEEQRRRLREIFHELAPPQGVGFIIRTAGMDRNKKELQGDLAYLLRLWQVVVRRIRKLKSPAEIYQESDMITRTIRDTFTSDIDTILVDEPNAYEHAKEFLQIVMPRYANRIKLYDGSEPLFHKYGLEEEIARIQMRHVPLQHGGSIVIDPTEALVAIDVNSGNFRADGNAEETAYQMNLRAAKEIARQLRLRDLGGVIVNDFIDMREEKHRRGVEKAMRDAVKRDRARTKILRISQFGIIEMTRQRIRPSLKRSVYQDCPYCASTGLVKTCESMSIDVMRLLQLAAHREHVERVQIRVADEVAGYLLNKKRREISRLEESGEILVQITGVHGGAPELLEFVCFDNHNNEVKVLPYDEPPPRRGRR